MLSFHHGCQIAVYCHPNDGRLQALAYFLDQKTVKEPSTHTLEQRIRCTYTGFVPQLHKRYIDDVVGASQCSRLELEDFNNYISNFHPALQFTSNISDLPLPFLDIKLKINNHSIQTSGHYKETDTHNYFHHKSLHPEHCKQAIPYSQLLQLRRICSDNDNLRKISTVSRGVNTTSRTRFH